jgi:gamma-glutamyltranspeptidase/glutathione hydrolase
MRICSTVESMTRCPVALLGKSKLGNHSIYPHRLTYPSSGVPGEVRGLEYIHKAYATMSWSELIQPALLLARDGFKIPIDLAGSIASNGASGFFVNDPAWAIDFAPNGTRLGLGDTLTRKRYADLLEVIAQRGPAAFYTGAIAKTTIRALQSANGIMTLDDLERYEVIIRKSEQIKYRDYKLTSCGAPSSGTVVLQVMKIAEGYGDFGQAAAVNLSTHHLDEAIRFGYGAVSLVIYRDQ